ncbi:gluconate 2-dehydrogenase subunit 3 family protein [Halieaceae bacterium]|nr:gluconate 2-dehydrogenase subunit 3 family protein [Halieaceae bacterium]
MQRRDAIKIMVAVLGGSLSPSLVMALESEQKPIASGFPSALKQSVAAMAERIIPTTDTPGAIAVGVPGFIEEIVLQWYTDNERQIFLDGCETVESLSLQQFSVDFSELSAEQQDRVLLQMESKAGPPLTNGIAMGPNLEESAAPFFHQLKQLSVVGYYTSEIGATQELRYDPMPMEYKGDVPLADVGGSWFGNGFFEG